MAEPVYDLVDVHSMIPAPCYDTASCKPRDATASSVCSSSEAKKPSCNWSCSCVLIGLVLVGVVACVSMAVAVWSIAKVNSMSAQIMSTPNSLKNIDQLNDSIKSAIDHLRSEISSVRDFATVADINATSSINSLRNEIIPLLENATQTDSNFNNTFFNSLDIVNRSIFNAVDQFQRNLTLSGVIPTYPATSCLNIFQSNPSTPSGHYWVRASNGSAVRVYCDMTRSCGGVTGGWMRVASLDFSCGSTPCPSGLQERSDSSIRTCGIQSPSAACASVLFSASGIAYNRVCGKVLAYQVGNSDAFGDFGSVRGANIAIDSNYVDGVSLTHGSNPRRHIWTFAAAYDEYGESNDGPEICECSHSVRGGGASPAFVGEDYFCDSGISGSAERIVGRFFSTSPLWDGSGCGSNSTCCSFNNPPWFYKQLPSPTSDAIETRVCCDEERSNEDIAMSSVEIYVQ